MPQQSDQTELGIKSADLAIIRNVCEGIPVIESVIVFGSRAMGTNRYNSDFDLVVKGENVNKSTISLLKEQLEDKLFPYRFDVMHDQKITHQDLLEHIYQYGKSIYESKTKTNSSK